MTPSELEAVLLAELRSTRFATANMAALQLRDVETAKVELGAFTSIGIDTNILKQLRREVLFADRLTTRLADSGVVLIVPEQSVVEFWNNHHIFASEDWKKLESDLGRLRKTLGGIKALWVAEASVDAIEVLIQKVTEDLQDSTSPEFLSRSTGVMEQVLAAAIRPAVSRVAFGEIARIRQQTKMPPGFADEARKGWASLGDFFAWCDFMLGALQVKKGGAAEQFLFVTDDSKPDWKAGGEAHPVLVEEFRRVTGGQLTIVGFEGLRQLVPEKPRPATSPTAESEL